MLSSATSRVQVHRDRPSIVFSRSCKGLDLRTRIPQCSLEAVAEAVHQHPAGLPIGNNGDSHLLFLRSPFGIAADCRSGRVLRRPGGEGGYGCPSLCRATLSAASASSLVSLDLGVLWLRCGEMTSEKTELCVLRAARLCLDGVVESVGGDFRLAHAVEDVDQADVAFAQLGQNLG